VQFWRGMAPIILKYKFVKFKAEKIDHCSPEELEQRLNVFRESSAPVLVNLIIRLGGIYVKIGQVMSTVGQGILPQQYVDALQPLQDGLPPRSLDEISRIVQDSTGKTMNDLFVSFDEKPIGAASIAQVHKAMLRSRRKGEDPKPVVVKVQYPEVAEMFEADLSNLETATRLFAPESIEVTKALRKRHENELDFTKEAENLRECTRDMQRYGLEPSLVRIPRVVEDICTPNVLAMEYLDGISLSEAIQQEQDKVAKALGKKDGDELKKILASRMRDHFKNGGGAASGMLGDRKMKILNAFGPSAAMMLRAYASARDSIENAAIAAVKFGSKLRVGLNNHDILSDDVQSKKKKKANVNLGRALKTMVHVHGIQLLLGGTYNADPHPGNVLILPDGRLGLLDYGMVGRLSPQDREAVAETILALHDNDKAATAKIYRKSGYKGTFNNEALDDAMLHRFASFHLDRIDLSPLTLDSGEIVESREMFRSVREVAVPLWVEESRRLGGLLMGVNAQAARPISLSKEWKPIAKEALRKP
jgi:predicted unusual protein kinase regulating ubiquinone biosynthesis (AarF/ABC1/UbiB family)